MSSDQSAEPSDRLGEGLPILLHFLLKHLATSYRLFGRHRASTSLFGSTLIASIVRAR